MNNIDEFYRRLKDGRACLEGAEKNLSLKDYRTSIQNAQLCIEMCAKAIISYFTEPLWQHDPSDQLLSIIKRYGKKISHQFYQGIVADLNRLSKEAETAAPWHAWSTYGKEKKDGSWIAAVDLCKKDIAMKLVQGAKESFKIAEKFSQFL